ncbi:MAG: fumarylacetoacetate hydrolase family protein [Janthinobacterium lividum]
MPRIANESGRLKLVLRDGSLDVEKASGGKFSSDPQAVFSRWDEFADWAASAARSADAPRASGAAVGSPVPAPRQLLGVGINFHSHINMSNLAVPTAPAVFARLVTSLGGPNGNIPVYSDNVVTEVEVAVVLKREAFRVSEARSLDYVAGITIGQDLIDPSAVVLGTQLDGKVVGRYNTGAKSYPGFAPIGPELLSLDEVADLGDLPLELDIDDTPFQRGNTSDMVFAIPELIARLTYSLHLLPGDIILSGTPGRVAGAEHLRLRPGQLLTARVQGLGEQKNRVTDGKLDPGVHL